MDNSVTVTSHALHTLCLPTLFFIEFMERNSSQDLFLPKYIYSESIKMSIEETHSKFSTGVIFREGRKRMKSKWGKKNGLQLYL